jgi:hypothetical protein
LYFYFSGRENKKVFKLNVVVNLICKNGVSVVALFFGLEPFKFKTITSFLLQTQIINNNKISEPILLRSHVLLMDFIGTQGWAAPRLQVGSPQ